jgi:hypothetical protein
MFYEAMLPPPTITSTLPTHCPTQPALHPTQLNHTNSWPEASALVKRDDDTLLGLDGELWFPTDSFHAYEGPTVFRPDVDWHLNRSLHHNSVTVVDATPPQLSPDAEHTLLPPGLMQSPPRQEENLVEYGAQDPAIQALCAAMIVQPSPVVLPAPSTRSSIIDASEGDGTPTGRVMRHSKCLDALPVSSHKPAERARDTQLKKWGLAAPPDDHKTSKIQQLILACKDDQ